MNRRSFKDVYPLSILVYSTKTGQIIDRLRSVFHDCAERDCNAFKKERPIFLSVFFFQAARFAAIKKAPQAELLNAT